MSTIKIELTEEIIERFWAKVDKKSQDECWGWKAYKNKYGYGQIRINNKKYSAHRISWFIHNGEIPEHNSFHGMCALHKCDNPSCVNPTHLFLGTHQENMRDRDAKWRGASLAGEKHWNHKLAEKQVIEIREKYTPRKYSTRKLAEEYGVSQTVIQRVIEYKNWKHIE